MSTAEKPITILNYSRLSWLLEGHRAHTEGLAQDDNPKPKESEAFDWWLFGWYYAQQSMLERN